MLAVLYTFYVKSTAPKLNAALVIISATGYSFILSITLLYNVINASSSFDTKLVTLGSWVSFLNLEYLFLFDSYTCFMCCIVTFISMLVQIYSLAYMREDPNFVKFIAYLGLFTFCMLLFVTAGNFIVLFAGWEGVGLVSFLLISFWNNRPAAYKAGMKAMLANRVGDVALLSAIALIHINFNTINLIDLTLTINSVLSHKENEVINIIALLLLIGVCGKSAQLGLHIWLPDAMEGPTPVSALLHAATMVTAGIFLFIRCMVIFEAAPVIAISAACLGLLTSIFAGIMGSFQMDLKRIIAYSTCSQLGLMLIASGISAYSAAMCHLLTHAFFKALLFLSAGVVIHALSGEQDIRKMGGLSELLIVTSTAITVGSLALMGFPFLAGFYSKENILEFLYVKSPGLYIFCNLSVFLTAFYSTRLAYFVFYSKPNMSRTIMQKVHEGEPIFMVPIFILSILSICGGYYISPFFSQNMAYNITTSYDNINYRMYTELLYLPFNYGNLAHFVPNFWKYLPLALSFLGVLIALISYALPKNRLFIIKNINLGPFLFFIKLVYAKFGFDKFYNTIVCARIILLLKHYLANFVIFTINILEENIRVNKFITQNKTKLNVINMVEIYIISSIVFISIFYYCLF